MIHKTSDYDSDIAFAVLGSTRPDRQCQIANGWKRPVAAHCSSKTSTSGFRGLPDESEGGVWLPSSYAPKALRHLSFHLLGTAGPIQAIPLVEARGRCTR